MTEGEWQATITKKLIEIETRLTTIEATRGTIKIPLAAWGIMWAILIALLTSATGAAFVSGQFSERLAAQQGEMSVVRERLHEHEVLKGHAGVTERLDALKEEVDKVERRRR